MTKTFRLSPIAIQLSESAVVPARIQVVRTGIFHHEKYGKFEISKAHLLSLKENFDKNVRGVDIALDFSHESEGEAAAWFKQLELSDDGTQLWAKPEWTDEGSAAVLGKRFRYISADINFDYQDNETLKKYGPTLLGAGLTNRPVVKGQAPIIELSEGKGPGIMEELKKENDALKAKIAELEAKLNGSAASEKALSDEKAKVAATETQLAEVKKQNLQLVEEKSKLEKATKLAEQKSIFDKKLSEGAVVEAQREAFMAGDMAKFMELQQATKTTTIGHGGAGKSGSEDSAQEEILKLAEKKMADKSADTLQVAIRMVLSENAELKKKYEAGAQA